MREKRVERRGVGAQTGACGVLQVGAASNGDRIREPNGGPMLPEELAGLFGNLGKIPDKGGRGLECVTPELPSHDRILLVKPRNRRYRQRHSSRRSSQG